MGRKKQLLQVRRRPDFQSNLGKELVYNGLPGLRETDEAGRAFAH